MERILNHNPVKRKHFQQPLADRLKIWFNSSSYGGYMDDLQKGYIAFQLLKELSKALDNSFISSWQTTSAWQKELDTALLFIKENSND